MYIVACGSQAGESFSVAGNIDSEPTTVGEALDLLCRKLGLPTAERDCVYDIFIFPFPPSAAIEVGEEDSEPITYEY